MASDGFGDPVPVGADGDGFGPPVPLAKPAPDAPVTLGPIATGAAHASRHLSFGLGDKITAAIEALNDLRHDKTGQTFGDIYARNLAFNDRLLENSDAAHPVARWVGNGIGVGGNLAALAAMAPARAALAARGLAPAAAAGIAAPTVFGRVLQGAGEGAKVGTSLGAVGGFGASRGDHPVLDTLVGGGFGAATGGVLGGAGGAIAAKLASRRVPQPTTLSELVGSPAPTGSPGTPTASLPMSSLPMVARGVAPDAEAQVLQRYGVPLTLGQMQPGGVASEAEEAALRIPLLGKVIEGQRKAAEQGWRSAVIEQTRPAAEGELPAGSAIEKLHQIKKDFTAAYDQIADKPAAALALHPETGELVHPREAFDAILADPNYQTRGEDLAAVKRIFDGQAVKMERMQAAGEPIKAGLLIDMRSDLRDAAQLARLNGNSSTSMMFQDAADAMGGGIRGTILPEDVALLNKTDAAYSRFMKVVGAAKRAGQNAEEGEFGPKHLSAELQKSYGLRFATDPNAGGPLRDLSRAGKYAFTPRETMTGHGEKLKSLFGLTMGGAVSRANASPAAQQLYVLAAQRAAQNGSSLAPPVAGEFEQALASFLGQKPITAMSVSPAVGSLQDLLSGSRRQ